MKIKKLLIILLLFSCLFYYNVYADEEYLPINYNEIRYSQGDNLGTNIWYSIIPAKYKMHYAYGNDAIHGLEKPSENAQRHHATLAVNSQYMGLVAYGETTLSVNEDVSQFDFYLDPNTEDSATVANMHAVEPTSTKIGIDLSYARNPRWCAGMCFITVIRDGTRVYDDENNYSGTANLVGGRHPRTWIVIDSQGNQYVAVAAGRNEPLNGNDFSLSQAGLTFDEMIDVTQNYLTTDIKYLFNLDGGGSSSFVYKGNMINPKYDDSFTSERAVHGIYYWKVDNYDIEYDLNGGNLQENATNPLKYNIDSGSIKLNNPTKEGYKFTGWLETIDGQENEDIQEEIVINSNEIGNRKYIATYKKIEVNDNNIKNPSTSQNINIVFIIMGILILGNIPIILILKKTYF